MTKTNPKPVAWRGQLLVHLTALSVCIAIWVVAFRVTGDRLDCRFDETVSFCALRAGVSGVSVQWGERQRPTLWVWRGQDNRRLWPGE